MSFVLLHLTIFEYSLVGIFSKKASQYDFLSIDFIKCYIGVIAVLGIYAILWQQAIKSINLNIAYANKAANVVWGIVWGMLLWGEEIKPLQWVGVLLVVFGVVVVGMESGKNEN